MILQFRETFDGLFGKRNTKIPPALSYTSLFSTNAFTEFSISIPVTLPYVTLFLTTISLD